MVLGLNRSKIIVLMIVFIGIMLLLAGFILAYYFNFYGYEYGAMIRYLGFFGGVALVFIGMHIVIAGFSSLRS